MAGEPKTAVVLAGGVAKGAFEAGALEVLSERGVQVSQVIGTSSGSLNASMLAAAVRAGRERDATARLVELWREDADWMHIFHLSWRDALEGRGLSDSEKIKKLMRDELPPILTAALHPIRLRFVVGVLDGVKRQLAHRTATTFEGVIDFDGEDLDDEARRENIYTAAAASAAFPLLFRPVDVPGLGPCYDGGVVNDAPVKLASDGGADRVIVIAPYPAESGNLEERTGVELAVRLVEALVHERLYRDLHEAEEVNRTIARLRTLADDGVLTPAQLERVMEAIGVRPLEVVTIRPRQELPGNAFAGFLHRELRDEYIAAGHEMAHRALDVVQR